MEEHWCGRWDGSGRTLLLLHGAGGDRTLWEGVRSRLEGEGIPALALDLPGHGGSPHPLADTVEELARGVASSLSALGVREVVAAGHSLGGAVALSLCGLFPVAGVALLSSGARLPVGGGVVEGLAADFEAMVGKITRAAVGKNCAADLAPAMEAMMLRAGATLLAADFTACARFSADEAKLRRLAIPASALCGTGDRMTPPELSREFCALVGGAELALLDGVGHMSLLEAPEEVARELSRLWGRSYARE